MKGSELIKIIQENNVEDLNITDLIDLAELTEIDKMILSSKLLEDVHGSKDIKDTTRHYISCAIREIKDARKEERS